jgi:NAD(P)-dependent dehydrogenase (short-subunit alcohol dehydrogenase family)
MDSSAARVVVLDSTGSAGLEAARLLLAEGARVVLVCGPDEAEAAGRVPEGDGRLAVLVDDGSDRRDAVAAACELAREMFAGPTAPEVQRA